MTPELQAAITDAYREFSSYAIGSTLVVCHCNCCMTEETERELVKTPLRQVQASLLAEYTNSAHAWDDTQVARELRYFLPRYFELIAANDPPDAMGLDICLRRLGQAQWRQKWRPAEVEIIDRFFDGLIVASSVASRSCALARRLAARLQYRQRADAGRDSGRRHRSCSCQMGRG